MNSGTPTYPLSPLQSIILPPWLRHIVGIAAMGLLLTGCGNSDDMSQREVEYLSHMDQAQFFKRQGELKASTQELRSAMTVHPDQIEPHFLLIENLLIAGDSETAERKISALREHLETLDEVDRALRNRLHLLHGEVLLAQERHESALEVLEKLQQPDGEQRLQSLVLTGDAYRQQARYDKAEDLYQQAHQLDGEAIMPLLGLSRTRFAQNDPEGALDWLQKAREIDENDGEVALWQARMAHSNGDLEQAREAYTRALEEIGRYDVMTQRKYRTISALIDVLQRQGNTSEAFVYEEILANSAPGTIRSSMEAAREQYQRGNLDKAAQHLQEVLDQAPQHQSAAILLGVIRFQQGDMEAAEERLAPYAGAHDSDELTKILAATRIRLQRSDEAIAMLEELDPEQSDPAVVALVGIATLTGEDHETGRTLIEKSLEMRPDNADLRARYSRYLLSQGETAKAAEQLREGIKQAPGADSLRILLAQLYLQRGQKQQASELMAQWREEQPDNDRAISASGDVAQALGEMQRAKDLYRQAIATGKAGYESHFALGGLEFRDGNRQQAIEHFRRAVSLAPEESRPLNALISLSRMDKETFGETIGFLQTLIKEQDSAREPRRVLLEHHLREGQYEQASEVADTLERIIDDRERAIQRVGSVYQRQATASLGQGQLGKAQQLLRHGRERYRQHEGLALVDARLQFQRDRLREAREILRTVKAEHPDSPGPYITEARYFMENGQFRQAVKQLDLARRKADTPETLILLSNAQRQAGEPDQALSLLDRGTQRFPESPQVWLHLAMTQQAQERQDDAIRSYQRTLDVDPDNTVALNNLAWLYHENNHEQALPLAEKAYRLNPAAAEVADTYGWILFRQGHLEEGIRMLEKAHEMAPDSQEIRGHLAEAYRKTDQAERASAL